MVEWRFLLDENVDPKTAHYLEKEGIRAEHVRDALGQGANDETDVLPDKTAYSVLNETPSWSTYERGFEYLIKQDVSK